MTHRCIASLAALTLIAVATTNRTATARETQASWLGTGPDGQPVGVVRYVNLVPDPVRINGNGGFTEVGHMQVRFETPAYDHFLLSRVMIQGTHGALDASYSVDLNADGELQPGEVEPPGMVKIAFLDWQYDWIPQSEPVVPFPANKWIDVRFEVRYPAYTQNASILGIDRDLRLALEFRHPTGSGFAVSPPTGSIRGPRTMVVGPAGPSVGPSPMLPVQPGQTDVVVADLRAVAPDMDMQFSSLTLAVVDGSPHWVSNVRLLVDEDGDGEAGPADTLLARSDELPGDARLTLSPADLTGERPLLLAGASMRLLVVLDVADSAGELATLRIRVLSATAFLLVEHSASGLPMDPGVLLVKRDRNPLAVVSGPASGAERSVVPGEQSAVVGEVVIGAVDDAVTLLGLTVTASGSVRESVDLAQIRLVLDRNRDGRPDGLGEPGGDELLASELFLTDNDSPGLTIPALVLPAGGSLRFLLVVDVMPFVTEGATVALTVTGLALADATVPVSGLPLALEPVPVMPAKIEPVEPIAPETPVAPAADDAQLADPQRVLGAARAGCQAVADNEPVSVAWLAALLLLMAARRQHKTLASHEM